MPGSFAPMRCLLGAVLVSLVAACTALDDHGRPPVQIEWSSDIARPEYANGNGPVVVVDAAHGNWHTIEFRFRPFADLIRADGYRVVSSNSPITAETLRDAEIFVIANAVLGGEESVWVLPTPPALTSDEVQAIVNWVEEGGALLLIADHMPFPGSVEALAGRFGAVFLNGYAKPSYATSGTLTFSRENSSLLEHAIANGRTAGERVESVKTFTGQAFRLVGAADSLLLMPDDWRVFLPEDAFRPFTESTPNVPARGLVQGAVLKHGHGRVALFGEAAMFTAQAFVKDDGAIVRFGLNDPAAADNAQFVLNVMHWLSGLLDP